MNTIQRLNGCTSIDCNRQIRVAHSRRMLLPHAQHRHDDVQRTYILQHRRIHHHAKPSKPNRIKSNPARESATQASVCVSTVIKVKSESNSMPPRRPAKRASLSWCQPRPMCNSSFRLAFQSCRVPVVTFVQQRDHADAGAGAERTTITNVTSQSIAQSPRTSAAKISRDSCNDTLPNTR